MAAAWTRPLALVGLVILTVAAVSFVLAVLAFQDDWASLKVVAAAPVAQAGTAALRHAVLDVGEALDAADAAAEEDVAYFWTDHALLGAYREKDLVQGQGRASLVVLRRDYGRLLAALRASLGGDHWAIMSSPTAARLVCGCNAVVDVVVVDEVKDKDGRAWLRPAARPILPTSLRLGVTKSFAAEDVFPLRQDAACSIQGLNIKSPARPEAVLARLFGADFVETKLGRTSQAELVAGKVLGAFAPRGRLTIT